MKKIVIIPLVIILVFLGYRAYQASQMHDHYDTDVHVHSDFAIYINDQRLVLTSDKYQSSPGNEKSEDVHIHDGNDHVVHRHADRITFADFLSSIGFTLTDDCFTMDTGEQYCTDDTNIFRLYVNESIVPNPTEYITEEENRILVYYGTPNNPNLQGYLDSVTDESCIPSGTCPERGVPEVESCGLTCDLKVSYIDHSWKETLKYVFTGEF